MPQRENTVRPFAWFYLALFSPLGCDLDAVDVDEPIVAKDAWDYANRPETFDFSTRSLEALPLQGEAKTIPWTGTYWPSMDDSMNAGKVWRRSRR